MVLNQQDQLLRKEQIKWFSILKAAEIMGLASVTVGAYYVGALIFWLRGLPLPHWFICWFVGLFSVIVLFAAACLLYLILAAWLKANWKWAGKIAKEKLVKQRLKK